MESTTSPSKARLSLDQLFQSTARHNLTTKPEHRILLTPLSKKACLIHGIDPSVLQNREYASFSQRGLDPEIQTMHYEVYMHTREKLMELASGERSKLKEKMNQSIDSVASGSSVASCITREQDGMGKDQIETEKRRLEKVARRQQKELLRMLAFESKSQAINDKMKKRAEQQAQKEFQRKQEKRKRDLKAAEDARIRELRKKADDEREAHLQRIKMQQQFERDKKIQKEKAEQEKEMKKRARQEEQLRAKKQKMYEAQTRKIFDAQRREMEQKMKERKAKERLKEEKLELKRLVDAQQVETKRKEAADRIDANLKAARTQEEEKRANLLAKQAKHDEIMARIKKEKSTEIQRQKELNDAMERKRKQMLQMVRKKEDALKDDVKKKMLLDEARRLEQQRELKREHDLRTAEREIIMSMKQANLARIKRQQEYHAKETLRKVVDSDAKSSEMKRKKAELIAIRKKNAHEAKIKKDQLLSVLDQTRGGSSSAKIKKLVKQLGLEQSSVGFHPPLQKSTHDDSGTVKTEQSVAMSDIGPPPQIPSSLLMRVQKNENDTQDPEMDAVLGLKNLCSL